MKMEIIKKNWNTFKTILNRLDDENINAMLEKIGERICWLLRIQTISNMAVIPAAS